MSSYYSDGRGRSVQQRNNSGRGASGRPTGSGSGRSTPRRKKKKRPIGLLLLVVLLVMGIVAGVNYFRSKKEAQTQQQLELEAQQQAEQEEALLSQQTIYEGVTLNGISLAGMTKEQAAQAAVDAGNLDASIQIKVNEVAPDMDKATLKSKFKKLASFTTTTTSNSNRNTNIRLCSTAINGAVVQPGEEFSVNNITGKRSAEKGYKDATVIKNGVYVQEPGGGVCQVSSTLFNAVVRAGLQITERHNHTIVSSYVPIGEDAAIDYPNKDFKFVNNSEGPIAIVMSFDESGKKLKATIYGIPILEEGVTLDLTSEVTDTIAMPEPTYTEDPTLAYGEEVTVTTGLEGKKVTTYLITLKDGKQISKEVLHKSNYPKRTPVIAVNTKAIPAESPSIPEEGGESGGGIPDEEPGDSGDGGFVIPEE